MIKWEQMIFLRNPEYGCDMQLIDFAGFTRACGETGFTMEDPSECGAILDQARAIPGPVIVEAGVEPIEPPMPPKLPLEQATKFALSLARDEPNRVQIALTTLADKVREFI